MKYVDIKCLRVRVVARGPRHRPRDGHGPGSVGKRRFLFDPWSSRRNRPYGRTGLTTAEREELTRLRKEVRILAEGARS